MIPKVILVLIFLTISLFCFAQQSDSSRMNSAFIPRHAIKLSPMHLLATYPTVQLAYEVRIAPFWTFQVDGGVVVDFGDEYNKEQMNKRGYKLKFEPHYYFSVIERRSMATYVALEYYFNNVDFDQITEQVECFDPGCQARFQRTYKYTVNYQEQGGVIKIGMMKYAGVFVFDFNTGFGIRFIDYTFPSYIHREEVQMNWYDIPRMEDRIVPSPTVNVKVGFIIR